VRPAQAVEHELYGLRVLKLKDVWASGWIGDGLDPEDRMFGHPGLHVADGSVMPGPVGPNPSLTIAALADRFAEKIIEERQPVGA
jgi:GMC oxidoreductase